MLRWSNSKISFLEKGVASFNFQFDSVHITQRALVSILPCFTLPRHSPRLPQIQLPALQDCSNKAQVGTKFSPFCVDYYYNAAWLNNAFRSTVYLGSARMLRMP